MPNLAFDAIIIGTGQAGPPLAARLFGAPAKRSPCRARQIRGTCVNNGCIPTKDARGERYAAHLARRASEYGVDIAARYERT
jgi:pyruvate/2-oxoglutarate dehydrogenase complex dihydrolipoamide dehydrogenase (E3) component